MATATLTLAKETVENLRQVAGQLGVSSTDLAEKAIRQYLRREAEKKIRREELAYRDKHDQLLKTHPGKYIALHNGQIVDHDEDELSLYLRIRRKYPLPGILIKKVMPEIDEVWHVRSPHLEYD